METSKTIKNDTKRVFWKMGTCSRTFFYLLNREFGHSKKTEERAADPFAGGILRKGYQCGMLWGAALAVGAESFRKCKDREQAIGLAIEATRQLLESFTKRTHTVNCREITNTDFSKKLEMAKYVLFKAKPCFDLAEKWAPEAIRSAREGLTRELTDLPQHPISCASEVARKMGASDEEMVMVAGFAGGLGLSGNACGALSAAIWMKSLAWSREHPGKMAESNPDAKNTLKIFYATNDSDVLCQKITGQCFKTIDDHTRFIKNDGCEKLINALARS